jgi:hypothetical protein
MGNKSPHDAHHPQKSAKSIKEKRAERKAKEEMTESQMARLAAERTQHRRPASGEHAADDPAPRNVASRSRSGSR